MKKRAVIGLVALLFLGFAVWRTLLVNKAGEQGQKPLRISLITWPGCGPGFLSAAKGYFGGLSVDFNIIDGTDERRAAFKSGKIDLHITTIDQLPIEALADIQGKVVILTDISRGADGVVAREGIASARDLRGKRIALAQGTPSHFFFLRLLSQSGVNSNEVSWVFVNDPSKAAEAFVSKSVDAAVTWEPYLSEAVSKSQGTLLATTANFPVSILGAFVASPSAINNRSTDLGVFVRGWLKAVNDINANPTNAMPAMAKGLKIPEADLQGMFGGMQLLDQQLQDKMLVDQNPTNAAALCQEASNLWKNSGIISNPKDTSIFFDSELNKHLLKLP